MKCGRGVLRLSMGSSVQRTRPPGPPQLFWQWLIQAASG